MTKVLMAVQLCFYVFGILSFVAFVLMFSQHFLANDQAPVPSCAPNCDVSALGLATPTSTWTVDPEERLMHDQGDDHGE